MADDVAERVKKVTAKILGCKPEALRDETTFVSLGAESLDSIKLVAGFEQEFDIDMDEDAALQVQTIGKAVEFVRQYV
jgi:acyl carrier protein